MKNLRKATVYFLVLNLLFFCIPIPFVSANGLETPSESNSLFIYTSDESGKVSLYEENNKESKQLVELENGTEVFVLGKNGDFTNVQYEIPEISEVWIGYVESNILVTSKQLTELNATKDTVINDSDSKITTDYEVQDAETSEDEVIDVEIDNVTDEATTENKELSTQSEKVEIETTNSDSASSQAISQENETTESALSINTASVNVKLEGFSSKSPTNMYALPDRSSSVLKTFSQDSYLLFYEYSDEWYRSGVNVNGAYQTVYINKDDVELPSTDSTLYEGVALRDVNAYSTPSESSSVFTTYQEGTIIDFYQYTAAWLKVVSVKDDVSQTAYVRKDAIEQVVSNSVKLEGVSIKSPTNMYASPTRASEVLRTFNPGSILLFYTYTTDWYKSYVSINGNIKTIYINKADIDLVTSNPEKLEGISIKSQTNMYAAPSVDSSVLRTFNPGSILLFYTYTTDWYKSNVSVNGKIKQIYIHKEDVELVDASPEKYEGVSLKAPTKMHSSPSRSSSVLRTFSEGSILYYYSYTSDWYKSYVNVNGKLTDIYIHKDDVENTTLTPTKHEGVALKSPTSMYKTPSRNATVLRTYKDGSVLKFYTYTSEWYKSSVWVNGGYQTIYIHKSDIDLATTKPEKHQGIALKHPTNMYASPDRDSRVLRTYSSGSLLAYYTYSSQWFKSSVNVNGNYETIYINKNDIDQLVDDPELREGVTLKSPTNFYEKPSRNSKVLRTFSKGSNVKYYTYTSSWHKSYVSVNGVTKTIYISSEDVGVAKPTVTLGTYLVTDNLNMRTQPSTSSRIITTIPQGKILEVVSKYSSNWYVVYYDGVTGYASSDYLQEVITGDPIYSRDSYQFIDLRTKAPVTASQINSYIADNIGIRKSVLEGKGQVFIDAGNSYGVNALFLAAHAIHESGFGTSNISLGKYNLFGFGAFDATPFIGAYRFSSIKENIDYIARELKASYLNPLNWKYKGAYLGFSTKTMNNARIDSNSEGMNFYYASDANWGSKIASHMEKILPYSKSYYDKAFVNTIVPNRPGIPAGSDIFPSGTKAVAKKDLVLNSKKGTRDAVKILKDGTTFTILEKTNDYWVKLETGGLIYWTESIAFDTYSNYISVKNLGRVTTDSLNVRSGPSTSYSKIDSLSLNQFVAIVIKSDGSLSTNSEKTWFEVHLPSGKKGWVSGAYIYRELN